MELGEHEPNEPPVADCDCRRCAVATRDALRKDAERYRWVETNCTVDFADARGNGWFTSPVDPDLIPLSDRVDDAILNGRGDSPRKADGS